jgi:hypothetical protein
MSPATFSAKLALIQQVVFAERASIRSRCLPLWTDVLLWRAGALTLLLPAVVPIRSWRRYGRHGQELLSAMLIALLILACLEVLATLVLLLAVRAVLLLLLAIALLFVVLSIALVLLLTIALMFVALDIALALLLVIALLFVVLSVTLLLLLVVHVALSLLLLRRLTVAWVEVISAVAAAAARMAILIVAVRHGNLCAELLVLVFGDD